MSVIVAGEVGMFKAARLVRQELRFMCLEVEVGVQYGTINQRRLCSQIHLFYMPLIQIQENLSLCS